MLSSRVMPTWSDRLWGIILIFLLVETSLYPNRYPIYSLPHGLMRRMYILQCLSGMFCRYLLSPFDLWYHLMPFSSLPPLHDLSIWWGWVLESPDITMLSLIFDFNYNICSKKLGTPISSACMSLECPFVELPSLSFLTWVDLKSILSHDMTVVLLAS